LCGWFTTRWVEDTAASLLGDAHDLCDRFAKAVDALAAGVISRQHVAVIHEEGMAIHDPDERAAYVTAVLDGATVLTPGRLKPVARVLADRYVERTLDDRHRESCGGPSGGDVWPSWRDGTAGVHRPCDLLHGIDDRLTQQARHIIDARTDTPASGTTEEPADTRTSGQVRADLLGDMFDSDTARTLAASAPGWERVLPCPTTGVPVAVGWYGQGKRWDGSWRPETRDTAFLPWLYKPW
jgi:hypothetical protein